MFRKDDKLHNFFIECHSQFTFSLKERNECVRENHCRQRTNRQRGGMVFEPGGKVNGRYQPQRTGRRADARQPGVDDIPDVNNFGEG